MERCIIRKERNLNRLETKNERSLGRGETNFFPLFFRLTLTKIVKKVLIRKKVVHRWSSVSNVVTWVAWVVFHCFISSIETNGCPSPLSGGFLINCPG